MINKIIANIRNVGGKATSYIARSIVALICFTSLTANATVFYVTPATRMETRLPWRPTRGSLTSPSHLVGNRTLGPPLENHPETPPSSRR